MQKSHSKELFSHTFTYGIGLFVNRFLSFLLIPLYTYYFKPGELGVFNILQSFWLVIAIFYLFGIETSFIKYFTDEKIPELKSKIYSTTLILLSGTSLVLSFIIFLFAGNISGIFSFEDYPDSAFLIKILALVLFADTIYRFPLLLLRAELQAKKYLVLNLISVFVNLGFNIIFIAWMKMGIESIFYAYIISCVVTLIVSLFITKKYLVFDFSKEKAKELIIYGNKFVYVGLFILFIDVSDRFFLKYFTDDATVGIYSANYKLASGMGLIVAAFKFAWTPYFLNLSDNPENKNIISGIFTNYFFAGLLLFLGFAFFIPPVVTYQFNGLSLLGADYWSGLIIIPFILLSYFFSGLFSNLNVAPFFKDKTSYFFLVTLSGALLNFILNIILIPLLNIKGAAISTLVSYFFMFIFIYYLSQKIYEVKYDWKKIALIIFIFGTGYFISLLFKNLLNLTGLYQFIINLLILTAILIISDITGIFKLKKLLKFKDK